MYLYNSLSRKIEKFEPIESNIVKMYVCGLTPDGPMHLGHAAVAIYSDVLTRYLMFKQYEVSFVQNITDIDDDILEKSKKAGKNWREFGNFWTKKYVEDIERLRVLKDHGFVRATESISSMQTIITKLIEKKHAYVAGGSVYFAIDTFPKFGELSCLNKKQMLVIAKERGGHIDDKNKRDPLDFVLWQGSNAQPSWESPWGNGRPGWHIECSAMIYEFLGQQIDIHGGGHDLIFPHHESEIAQSESFTSKKFVKYWMHTAMILKDGEKMAKSLGNLVLVSDLLKKYSANVIRWYILSNHYRLAWEFDAINLKNAEKELNEIIEKLHSGSVQKDKNEAGLSDFQQAMDDDLDTSKALSVIKKTSENGSPESTKKMLEILGFSV